MTSKELRKKFLEFFEKRGHKIIPSASLVPKDDPSVLFNTAGMQPLVPYLLGQEHPQGTRLVNFQKCVRTQDIDEVGDNTHDTFFEMLGNWSLGDYFKKEAIEWSYEFLTSNTEGLGLNPERLYVTCFEGDENAPQDLESSEIWREIFNKNNIKGERIYFRSAKTNWWPQPKENDDYSGPTGPDTEMFYDLTGNLNKGMTLAEYIKADDEQKIVEVGNDVFMEYIKKNGKVIGKLVRKNVDTGSGFERLVMAVQGKTNIFDIDLFSPIMEEIRKYSKKHDIRSERIVADHVRTAVFMIGDGVTPSNTDRGYILRRLLRRAVRHADTLDLPPQFLETLVTIVINIYSEIYNELLIKKKIITSEISSEEGKFRKTLSEGLKEFEKGTDAFTLFSSYGFPIELTLELASEKGIEIDKNDFDEKFKKHQEISRVGSERKFQGGLSGTGEMETKYHTTAHLLHQALRDVFSSELLCKGSNITPERLRFDFPLNRKVTDDEKKKLEDIVNEKIKANLRVNKVVMKKEDAEKTGALHVFNERYPDEVNVYFIGDSLDNAYSKEFCGGPHTENTGTLGKFKIIKEEAVSSGIRRIKAVLE